MSKESREDLSCFMDGEISKESSRFLVRRLGADGELRATWARYHLVRDCLRNQEGDLTAVNLSGRIQQALASESQQSTPPGVDASQSMLTQSMPVWLKPVAGMAIAASVALMAIVAVGPGQSPIGPTAAELVGSPQPKAFVSPNNALAPSPVSQQVSVLGGTGSSNQKMNSYLLRHYQATDSTGGKGFVTFVPIVVTQAAAQTGDEADEQAELKGDAAELTKESQDSQDRANESKQK
jgi:sigma-E factor negative regulatory protein RseA